MRVRGGRWVRGRGGEGGRARAGKRDLAILLLSVFLTRRMAVMLCLTRKCCAKSGEGECQW